MVKLTTIGPYIRQKDVSSHSGYAMDGMIVLMEVMRLDSFVSQVSNSKLLIMISDTHI